MTDPGDFSTFPPAMADFPPLTPSRQTRAPVQSSEPTSAFSSSATTPTHGRNSPAYDFFSTAPTALPPRKPLRPRTDPFAPELRWSPQHQLLTLPLSRS